MCRWGLDTGGAVSGETGICLKTTHCVGSVCSGDAANHRGAPDLQGNASQHYTNMNRLAVCHISVTSAGWCKCELHVSSLYSQHTPVSLLMLHFNDTVTLRQICTSWHQSKLAQVFQFSLHRMYKNCFSRNPLVSGDCRGLCVCVFLSCLFLYFLTCTACLLTQTNIELSCIKCSPSYLSILCLSVWEDPISRGRDWKQELVTVSELFNLGLLSGIKNAASPYWT